MDISCIDVRYNLEFVGYQRGLNHHGNTNDKIEMKENFTVSQIKNKISGHGCPNRINETWKSLACGTGHPGCIRCWKQLCSKY